MSPPPGLLRVLVRHTTIGLNRRPSRRLVVINRQRSKHFSAAHLKNLIRQRGIIRAGTGQNNRTDRTRQQVDHFLPALTRCGIRPGRVFVPQGFQGVLDPFGKPRFHIIRLTRRVATQCGHGATAATFVAVFSGHIDVDEARHIERLHASQRLGKAAGRGMTVYGATKAFVMFLSQGLSLELSPRGVYVQAVLPAATRTEIWDRSGVDINTLDEIMDVGDLVDTALVGFDRREAVTIPPLQQAERWDDLQSARQGLLGHIRQSEVAQRYQTQQ